MAVRLNAGDNVKRGDLYFVNPFEVIVREELRGRHFPPTPEDIIERATSIYDYGQLQPVECRRIEDNKPLLTLGFTRCAAVRLIREGFVGTDGVARHDPERMLQVKINDTNDEAAFIRNVKENADRNQTSDIDDAFNQQKLRADYGYSDADIARLYGYKNQNRVGRLRKLLQLDKDLQLLVHRGEMPTQAALDLLDLPQEARDEAIKNAKRDNGKVSGSAVRNQVREHILNDNHKADEVENAGDTPQEVRGAKARSMREMRKLFERLKEESDQEAIQNFARTMLSFIAGKKTERAVENALNRVLDSDRTERTDAA